MVETKIPGVYRPDHGRWLTAILAVVFLLSFSSPTEVIAQGDWSWTTSNPSGSGSGYATKSEAVQAMRGSCEHCGKLTIERISGMSSTKVSYEYTGTEASPFVSRDWLYKMKPPLSSNEPLVTKSIADSQIAEAISNYQSHPGCTAAYTQDIGEWIPAGYQLGFETVQHYLATNDNSSRGIWHYYYLNYNHGSSNPPDCYETYTTFGYYRNREVDCPNGYLERNANPYCILEVGGLISGPIERCEGNGSGVGNPCSAGTGDKTQRESDYQSESLSFTRQYHSRADEPYSRNGFGWMHNYARRLAFNGATSPGGLITENGYHKPLRYDFSTQTYYADVGTGFALQKQGTEWHLTRSSKNIEVYAEEDGRLLRIERDGQTTQLFYNPDGSLQQVVGPFNHTLIFTYVGAFLDNVTDPEGNQYKYRYSGIGNLTKVIYPGGLSRLYHYEDTDFPHHLTGITDENGDRFATFAYDDEGRAILTEHAQTDNGAPQEQFRLDYGN